LNTENRGIGDNRPANPLQTYLDDLSYAAEEPVKELNRLRETQAKRIPEAFASEEQCCKGITLAIMLGDLIDTIELLTRNHRKPLDDMTKIMRTNGTAWTMLGEDFRQQVRMKINAFMDALPPGHQIRTQYGELATRREVFKFEVTDAEKVPVALKAPDDALIKAWITGKTKDVNNPDVIKAILETMKTEAPGIRVYREPQLVLTQGGKI